MAGPIFNDQSKSIPEGYSIITKVEGANSVGGLKRTGFPSPADAFNFYKSIVESELSALGSKKCKFLDATLCLVLMEHESNLCCRIRNVLPARGLGQFIYGTQQGQKVYDAYNYADHLKGLIPFTNDNFKYFEKKLSAKGGRDIVLSCGIAAHLAGRGGGPERYKNESDLTYGISCLDYVKRIEGKYRGKGGTGFTPTFG